MFLVVIFLQFFAEVGFPCPTRRNPSDHFLRCINSDFDNVTASLMESHRLVCVLVTALLSLLSYQLQTKVTMGRKGHVWFARNKNTKGIHASLFII